MEISWQNPSYFKNGSSVLIYVRYSNHVFELKTIDFNFEYYRKGCSPGLVQPLIAYRLCDWIFALRKYYCYGRTLFSVFVKRVITVVSIQNAFATNSVVLKFIEILFVSMNKLNLHTIIYWNIEVKVYCKLFLRILLCFIIKNIHMKFIQSTKLIHDYKKNRSFSTLKTENFRNILT